MGQALLPQHAEPVAIRLARLGLSEALLSGVSRRISLPFTSRDPYWPPTAAGMMAWIEGSTALREALVPDGWRPDDRHGLGAVVNADQSLRLLASRGDDNVGRPSLPRSARQRGALFHAIVDGNVAQGELFPDSEMARLIVQPEKRSIPTWVLLYVCADHEMRFELSRPRGYDRDGVINDWKERIPLPAISANGEGARFRDPVLPPPPIIDFEVRLR